MKLSMEAHVITSPSEDGSLAVLFSGGVDSCVLAALLGLSLPKNSKIDLLNVSFPHNGSYEHSPDRKACQLAFKNLCEVQPDICWNLVLIDIPAEELQNHVNHVKQIMLPSNTLMDITISAPLWFASRGIGRVISYDPHTKLCSEISQYHSQARVLLVGHGADEQLGGYGRHKVSFIKGGYLELNVQLKKDIARLWIRNLGRDDRVLSDHGKEVRHPFLDERVILFLSSLSLDQICDFENTLVNKNYLGDKKILRVMAEKILHLQYSSTLPKRAIQFGTHIAKQFPKNRNTKGTDSI
jgi:asparagine synthetase B (glutamine-hydrolysing)